MTNQPCKGILGTSDVPASAVRDMDPFANSDLGYKPRLRAYKMLLSVSPHLRPDGVELHPLVDTKEGSDAIDILRLFQDPGSSYPPPSLPWTDMLGFGVYPFSGLVNMLDCHGAILRGVVLYTCPSQSVEWDDVLERLCEMPVLEKS
jgi:hypothetical protein